MSYLTPDLACERCIDIEKFVYKSIQEGLVFVATFVVLRFASATLFVRFVCSGLFESYTPLNLPSLGIAYSSRSNCIEGRKRTEI